MLQIIRDQFKLLKDNPSNEPVIMLNLLKFKPEGGAESYARYIHEADRMIQEVGGKIIFLGRLNELLTGTECWDVILLVEYPSRKAFLSLSKNPEYYKIYNIREEALDRTVLYAIDKMTFKELAKGKES